MDLPFDSVIPLLGIYPKEPKTLIQKSIDTPMFIAALFAITNMKAAQVSISKWLDKTTMGHLYNGILLGHKKEKITFAIVWMDLEIKKEKGLVYMDHRVVIVRREGCIEN